MFNILCMNILVLHSAWNIYELRTNKHKNIQKTNKFQLLLPILDVGKQKTPSQSIERSKRCEIDDLNRIQDGTEGQAKGKEIKKRNEFVYQFTPQQHNKGQNNSSF